VTGRAGLGAALAAAVAAWLVVPSARSVSRRRPEAGRRGWWGVAAVAVGTGTLLDGRTAALAAVAAMAFAGAAWLWRRRVARVEAAASRDRVLEACRLLRGELAAGRPPGTALELAAEEWAVLAPVAEAFRLGASVPEALRRLGRRSGAEGLVVLGAAWDVAQRSGQGLAVAVGAIADQLTADAAMRRVVAAELSSARATARVVAALPVVALLMGSGVGGDPWGFLLGTPVGLACLAGGVALVLAGLAWIEAIAAGVLR
jgi:tight adherence protein B